MEKTKRIFRMSVSLTRSVGLVVLVVLGCLVLAPARAGAGEPQAAANASAEAPQKGLDEAIDQIKQKIAAEPSSEKAQVELGNLLLKKDALEEAAEAFDRALSLNPRYHDAMTGKGIVLARMGRDEEAEQMLQKALVLNPNPVRTHYELGSLYEKRGDYAKAIAEYKAGMEKYRQGRN